MTPLGLLKEVMGALVWPWTVYYTARRFSGRYDLVAQYKERCLLGTMVFGVLLCFGSVWLH